MYAACMRLSVIVPTWNRADLLVEAIESVSEARVRPVIIVVDDGSQDKTESVVSALSCRYPLQYIPLSHAGYPGRCRNIGVEAADTEWIAFLDSDDRWLPEKLSRQMDELERTGLSLCHTRERWLRAGTEVSQSHMRHARQGDIFSDAVKKCIVGPSTTLMRRDLFLRYGGYREDLEVAEDYEFLLRLLAFEKIAHVDIELIEKRAGLAPQLSEKYAQIEGFRIQALAGFVVDAATPRRAGGVGGREGHAGGVTPRGGGKGLEGGPTQRGQGHRYAAGLEGGPPPRGGAMGHTGGQGYRYVAGHAGGPPPARLGLEALTRVGRPPEPRWGSVDPASVPAGKLAIAARELARKCRVYARGAAKRGRDGDASLYEQAAREAEAVIR